MFWKFRVWKPSENLIKQYHNLKFLTGFFLYVCIFLQVGLISDEKLVDLLDLALSADTVNTVKNLREIMEAGVEPLALMSQLATIITDILAGTYVFTRERLRRKFFRRPSCESKKFFFPLFFILSMFILNLLPWLITPAIILAFP